MQQLAKAEIIPHIGRGEFDLSETIKAYISYIKVLHEKEIERQKKRHALTRSVDGRTILRS